MQLEIDEALILAVLFVLSHMLARALVYIVSGWLPQKSTLTEDEREWLSTLYRLHSAKDESTGVPRWWFPTDMTAKQTEVASIIYSMRHDLRTLDARVASIDAAVKGIQSENQRHDAKLDVLIDRGNSH